MNDVWSVNKSSEKKKQPNYFSEKLQNFWCTKKMIVYWHFKWKMHRIVNQLPNEVEKNLYINAVFFFYFRTSLFCRQSSKKNMKRDVNKTEFHNDSIKPRLFIVLCVFLVQYNKYSILYGYYLMMIIPMLSFVTRNQFDECSPIGRSMM